MTKRRRTPMTNRRRFRMLLTRDTGNGERITLWLVSAPVQLKSNGHWFCVAKLDDDCVEVSPAQCQALLGWIPNPGEKFGVTLQKKRWHG